MTCDTGEPAAGLPAPEPATPFLVVDTHVAVQAYERLRAALPAEVHYAVKCQPHPNLCAALAAAGGKFEVASATEVTMLTGLGVDASQLVFSNPVKSRADITAAYAAGVRVFAFDSPAEVIKLAEHAPGSTVMVRLSTAVGSEVPSEGKFGVDAVSAATLLLAAAEAGLDAAGVAFHVGSQCVDPGSWVQAIDDAAQVMRAVDRHGLRVRLLDIGGGFPTRYAGPPPPPIETYGRVIGEALTTRLPYPVERVIAEPGRAIAAEAGTMVTTVIVDARRHGTSWLHLDAGAFHGLIESLETGCTIPWPVRDSRDDAEKRTYTLTGPSCDSQDTIVRDVQLSAGLREGDRVMIDSAGAYTTAYTAPAGFNGFPVPTLVLAGSHAGGDIDAGHNSAADQAYSALAEYASAAV